MKAKQKAPSIRRIIRQILPFKYYGIAAAFLVVSMLLLKTPESSESLQSFGLVVPVVFSFCILSALLSAAEQAYRVMKKQNRFRGKESLKPLRRKESRREPYAHAA